MTLKLAVSRSRPSVPYGANFVSLSSPGGTTESEVAVYTCLVAIVRTDSHHKGSNGASFWSWLMDEVGYMIFVVDVVNGV